MQADRRRINPPSGGTAPPVFITDKDSLQQRPTRSRPPDEHRKIFLRTGIVPSASGSAYYEIAPPSTSPTTTEERNLVAPSSSLKITCTVHGPRPLPRNAAFSPNLLLTTHVKFAPFATKVRRGYVRDASERDLGAHLETALRGCVIGERWAKSACEVVLTVLEAAGEDDGGMGVLAGCITVACAALVDAGIDCVDLVSGGVAAVVRDEKEKGGDSGVQVVLDPEPAEHENVKATCVVGYLLERDEITEMWMKGDAGSEVDALVDGAVRAAMMTRTVLVEAVKEAVQLKLVRSEGFANGASDDGKGKGKGKEVTMTG